MSGSSANCAAIALVGPAIAAEDIFRYSSLSPGMGATIRKLAAVAPRTLALMHGPSFNGDCIGALNALAADYDQRVIAAMKQIASTGCGSAIQAIPKTGTAIMQSVKVMKRGVKGMSRGDIAFSSPRHHSALRCVRTTHS